MTPIFKKLKLIESWGTGIQRMQDEVSRSPDIVLEFRETEYSFQVCFIKKDSKKHGQSQKSTIIKSQLFFDLDQIRNFLMNHYFEFHL